MRPKLDKSIKAIAKCKIYKIEFEINGTLLGNKYIDNIIEELAKGFFRGIGYIIAEIFFGTICYWVGWPVCKVLTIGKYPSSNDIVYLDDDWSGSRNNNFWCSAVGLLVIILISLYFMGQFS